jgi:hypothetical protein
MNAFFLALYLLARTSAPQPLHCKDSFFATLYNLPTPSSKYSHRYGGAPLLISTSSNEIKGIDEITAAGELIGFLYITGDGTRFISERPPQFAKENRHMMVLYRKLFTSKNLAHVESMLYGAAVLLPRSFNFPPDYKLSGCVGP